MAIDYNSPMDPLSVDGLCSRAATAPSNTTLRAIWRHAFKAGQDNASQMANGMQVSKVLKIGFEKGQVHGIIQECELWEMAGHSQICLVMASSFMTTADAGTQVDLVTLLPTCTNTSIQTIDADIQTSSTQMSPPPLVNVDTQMSITLEPSPPVSCLDWAEDTTSLPILPLLPISSVSRQHYLVIFQAFVYLSQTHLVPSNVILTPRLLLAITKKFLLLNFYPLIIDHHCTTCLHFLKLGFSLKL